MRGTLTIMLYMWGTSAACQALVLSSVNSSLSVALLEKI